MFAYLADYRERREGKKTLASLCRQECDKGASHKAADLILSAYQNGEIDFCEAKQRIGCMQYCCDLSDMLTRFSVHKHPSGGGRFFPPSDAVLGAMYGDIIGSVYEGHRTYSAKEALLDPYAAGCRMTDDSLLTMATYAVIQSGEKAVMRKDLRLEDITEKTAYSFVTNPYTKAYREMAKAHGTAGYGPGFISWVVSDKETPYGSYGNGSAMRVSPAGALFDDQRDVIRAAYTSAMSTHNHIEGVKGAIVTAMCIWMARHGYTKSEIVDYMRRHYSYGERLFSDFSYTEAGSVRRQQVTCQYSVPAAVIAFAESISFQDAVNKAVRVGWDTDTNACICGGIAGAYYGVPTRIKDVVSWHCGKNNLSVPF